MVEASPASSVTSVVTTSPGWRSLPFTRTAWAEELVTVTSAPASVAAPSGSESSSSASTLRSATSPRMTWSATTWASSVRSTTVPCARTWNDWDHSESSRYPSGALVSRIV